MLPHLKIYMPMNKAQLVWPFPLCKEVRRDVRFSAHLAKRGRGICSSNQAGHGHSDYPQSPLFIGNKAY